MTRFARAKGSKSSNERLPESATPWSAMKKQLLENIDNLKHKESEKQIYAEKTANYQKFLKEKEDEENKHAVWASFPVQRNKSLLLNNNKGVKNGKVSKIEKQKSKVSEKTIKKKKLKLVSDKEEAMKSQYSTDTNKLKTHEISNDNTVSTEVSVGNKEQKQKKNKVNKNKTKQIETNSSSTVEKKNIKKNKHGGLNNSKNKKSQVKLPKKLESELTEVDLKKIEKKKQKKIKQLLKKKQFKEKLKEQKQNEPGTNSQDKLNDTMDISKKVTDVEETPTSPKDVPNEPKKTFKKFPKTVKNKKKEADGNHQRRKPTLPHKMFINGKELEIAYIEGFPVKKEDAERLKKLRKEMISKGLPRSQIDMALKLERRKAEKALAREKKKVCFNCRKSGHNLSECPELDKNNVIETAGSGICFKCGSTEHTHFECKVVKGQEYKFAQCFICHEQGHISRQCPDNARGLYPKGGACKVCGDVTHLKKDCPQYQAQQQRQENHVMIQTLGDSNPEELEETKHTNSFTAPKKQNKIIKFV